MSYQKMKIWITLKWERISYPTTEDFRNLFYRIRKIPVGHYIMSDITVSTIRKYALAA